jgi:hypothetical protein
MQYLLLTTSMACTKKSATFYALSSMFPSILIQLTRHGEKSAIALFKNMFCDAFSMAVLLGVTWIVCQRLFVFKKTLPYFL